MKSIFAASMARAKMRPLLTMAAMIVAIMAGTTGVASASAPNPGFYIDHPSIDPAHGTLTSQLPVDMRVGDCIQFGGASSFKMRAPVSGVSDISWTATVETTHTNNADVWHGTFFFQDNAGHPLGQSPRLDGLPMTQVGKLYSWTIPSRANINPVAFALIRKIMWKGEC